MTHPMLYFGMWAACFAWHTEDKDLNSINHLHFGAPKVWYSVPAAYKAQVDKLAAAIAPEEFARCSQFIRHKQMVIHPSTLTAAGIPVFTTVQYPGDTILTMAGAYHCGFNTGLNLAESCNYATFNWLALASSAAACGCMPDAVCDALPCMKPDCHSCDTLAASCSAPPPRFELAWTHSMNDYDYCSRASHVRSCA